MQISYEWKVGGLPVVESETTQQQGVWCERGCAAGIAVFYMRESDADALPDKLDITVNEFRDGIVFRTVTFKDYYPVQKHSGQQDKNVRVTLKDKRVLLERTAKNTVRNQVRVVSVSGATQTIYYVEEYCKPSNVPYTMDEIIEDLFTVSGLDYPSLPVSPANPPDNIALQGDCAKLAQGLLSSLGCDLVLDPFTGDLSIVLLSDNQDTLERDAFEADGWLVDEGREYFTLSAEEKTGKLEISPADYFHIQFVGTLSTTFYEDGNKSITIIDHQLAEDDATVKTAREDEIKEACKAWYTAQNDVWRETYFGIVDQSPGEQIRCSRWLMCFGDLGTRTVLENNAIPIPWATRVVKVAYPEVEVVQVLSNTKDSDGYYPGEVKRFDVSSRTWLTVRTCKVRDVNA